MISKSTIAAAIVGFALSLTGVTAQAGNLITNGSFEQLTGGSGQIGYNGNNMLTGWTNGTPGNLGYSFVYTPGTASSSGGNGVGGNVTLWGPGNGSNNGLGASPDGGNFIAADGAYEVAPISQKLTGLTVNAQYAVSFYYAGAQQSGFDGATTEAWDVSLGSQTIDTATLNDASHGFTGGNTRP